MRRPLLQEKAPRLCHWPTLLTRSHQREDPPRSWTFFFSSFTVTPPVTQTTLIGILVFKDSVKDPLPPVKPGKLESLFHGAILHIHNASRYSPEVLSPPT